MTPTFQTVETGNVKLRTQRRGTSKTPSLLFLHGGAGLMDDFDPLIERFSQYDCVRMDSRGHGGSTLDLSELSYPILAGDAEAVIQHYGLERPFVIGHSDGGIAGFHVAARGKIAISGLVTIAAHANPPPTELLDKVFRPLTADKWRERFPDGVELYEKLNPDPDFDPLFQAVKAMWINEGADNYPYDVLDKIDAPTLVLCGDGDHLVGREQTLALAEALPQAAFGLFPFGSHVFHQEHPELVAPFITQFIENVSKKE